MRPLPVQPLRQSRYRGERATVPLARLPPGKGTNSVVRPPRESCSTGMHQHAGHLNIHDYGDDQVTCASTPASNLDDPSVAESNLIPLNLFSHVFNEIKKRQDELQQNCDKFRVEVTARLERLESFVAMPDSARAKPTIREYVEEQDLYNGLISHEITRQIAILEYAFCTEVTSTANLAWANNVESLHRTLEARLLDMKAETTTNCEGLRETLQYHIGVSQANLRGMESRFDQLEWRLEQTVHALPEAGPKPQIVASVQNFGPIQSPAVMTSKPAASLRTRSLEAQPQSRQDLDCLHERLAGKVSGIVSVLNRSSETTTYLGK